MASIAQTTKQLAKQDIKALVADDTLDKAYAWLLEKILSERVECPVLMNLVMQYCKRVEIRDGNYYHFSKGIPMGCPLSPLISFIYLKPLDDALRPYGFYVRFMDDWLIMVKTKRQLRKVIKVTHRVLNTLKLKMHPQKTFLGRIKKGFDFLGVRFSETPEISKTTVENHLTRLARRYALNKSPAVIIRYRARWKARWTGLLKCCMESSNNLSGLNGLIDSISRGTLKDEHYENVYENFETSYIG